VRFATVCSGIEACSVTWKPLGWQPVFYSEIEKFPCAVLDYRLPETPNLGDMREIDGEQYRGTVDVMAAGTPCQSFSVAGKRAGLDDPRGNLALVYLRLVKQIQPRWVVWENVPGVLSSNKGRDFGAFLWTLGQCGYGWSYRVLDAKHWGVPQRRRRLFVVGCLGDWRRAAAVLPFPESLCGDTAQGKAAGEETARCLRSRPNSSHRADSETYIPEIARCLNGSQVRIDGESETFLAFGHNKSATQTMRIDTTTDALQASHTSQPAVYVAHSAPTIPSGGSSYARTGGQGAEGDNYIAQQAAVRRLTPRECERLQGFPDDWTLIPYRGKPAEQCPDSPRYSAIGNSMCVNVMRWIGERIQQCAP